MLTHCVRFIYLFIPFTFKSYLVYRTAMKTSYCPTNIHVYIYIHTRYRR